MSEPEGENQRDDNPKQAYSLGLISLPLLISGIGVNFYLFGGALRSMSDVARFCLLFLLSRFLVDFVSLVFVSPPLVFI